MNPFGLGALEFQMMADLVPLKRDMDQAKGLIGGSLDGIKGLFAGALGGLAAGLSLAAFTGWIKGAIEAGDATKAFSQKTGIAASDVAGLQLAFKQGGVAGDALTGSMSKLSKQVVEGNSAFESLGVKTRNADGSLRTSKDVLYSLADAFSGMEDGARKSALAQEVFGKSGAAMIPTLNEGSKGLEKMADMAEKLGLVIDSDAAEAADGFNDTMELLGMTTDGVGRQVAAQLLPTLNSLAGSMLDNVTSGDKMKRAADILAAGLKGLFSIGAIGVEVFNTVGKAIGGVAAAAVAVAQGEFSQAWKILEESGRDTVRGWGDTAKTISDVWTEAGADTVAQAKAMTSAVGGATVATKEQEAASKKLAEEQAKLTKAGQDYLLGLNEQFGALQQEIALGRALTDGEKEQVKLTEQLTKGKIVLTAAEEASARAKLAEMDAIRQHRTEMDAYAKTLVAVAQHSAKWADEQGKSTDTLRAGNVALIEENAKLGMTEQAWFARQQAVLLSRATDLEWQAANEGGNWQLEEQARLLRERSQLLGDGVVLKEAKAAADEWKKTTDSIGAGLTDSLMRAFESGRGFFTTLWDGIKNLFKTTVLRLLISPVQQGINNVVGAMMGAQASNGTSGSGVGGAGGLASLYNTGSSMYSGLTGSTMAAGNYAAVYSGGAYGTGFASQQSAMLAAQEAGMTSAAGSSAMGSAASYAGWAALIYAASTAAASDYSKGFNAQSAKNTGTAEGYLSGAIADALMSIGIAGEASSILSTSTPYAKLFGMGEVDLRQEGLTGTIKQGGVTDAAGYQMFHQEGGLFRSDRDWTDATSVGAEMSSTLNDQAANVFAAVKRYGDALGLPADELKNVVATFNVKTIRDSAAVSAEEIKSGLADAFKAYQDALFESYGPILKDFQHAGETVQETLGRLSIVRQFSEDLNGFGGVFSRIANLSMAAKEELINFAGGMDALMAKTQSFVGSYYSEAEQMGLQARQVQQMLTAAGVDGADLNTKAEFRALVESQNLGTTEGRKILNELLSIAPAFAALGDYMEKNGGTLGGLASAAPQSEVLMGLLGSQQATADAIATTGTNTVTAINAASTSTVDAVNALTDRIAVLETALTDALARNARTVGDAITEVQP